jgi:hypothetical protein
MSDSTAIAIVGIVASALSSAATLAVQGYLDSRMESKKALLSLGSSLYERRLDVISSLYALLRDVETLFQQITRPVFFKGEPPRDETAADAIKAYHAFVFEFLRKRVLLPGALTVKIDALIEAFWQAGVKYSYATDRTLPNGESRANDFEAARTIVQVQVPELLGEFERECRNILEPKKAAA